MKYIQCRPTLFLFLCGSQNKVERGNVTTPRTHIGEARFWGRNREF